MIRYRCLNEECICTYFRGGSEDTACPVCNSRKIIVVELGVGE